jgi:hypothetical protein
MDKYLNLSFNESLDLAGTLILIRNTRRELGYSPWDLSDNLLLKHALSLYYVQLIEEKIDSKYQKKLDL